ncbi:MAG: MBG domain-containing protein [Polynucleobacter sp.]
MIPLSKLAVKRTVVSFLIASFAQQSLAGNLAPNALPTGGNVVAGNAAISQSGNVMNVNQSSQRAVVNWQSFNVGKDATVNFNQPNAAASTLNVVNGASRSMINGAVNAPGQVIFVNNNGVVFGKNAEVNVGGLVATTMNVNQDEYMAGKKSLTYEGGQTGKVVNKGRITATSLDGYIALMAPQVKNEGVITAIMSGANSVALVSGQKVTLTFETGQALKVSVDASVVKSLIENKRLIQTNGGQIILAANSAQELMGSTIKNTGTASADGVRREGGQVFLVADNVTQSGTVSANSDTAAAGQVAITGKKITLTETSKTTATGATAGGKVLVGTDKVVPTQATRLAENVMIAQGALVDVSATQNGNGGSISIWSSIQTAVAGTLKAMGGVLGGNGGFIETSSKGSVILNKGIAINTTAPKGKSGTWVLDPIDLVIDSQAANVISNTLTDNNVTISVAGSACPSLGACTQNGTGALTIAAAIQKVSGLSTTLSLLSTGAFNLNADISGQNLSVIISSSIAYLNVGTTINAKQVTVQAQTIYANGNINASASDTLGGAISLLAQALYISGRLNASAGSNTSSTNTSPSSVTYNGQIIRREDLPTFLTAQNTGTRSTVLDQVFSTTAANDPNVAAPVWSPANQNNVIYLMADQVITLANNAQVIANGTNNIVSQIHLSAPTVDLQSGSLIQANGNNGPGGQVFISANQATFSGSITANSDLAGGSILVSTSGSLAVNGLIQANGNNGPGGSISLSSTQDIQINSASITANGSTDGGSLLVISSAGSTTLQNALIQTNGSNGRGGSIGISAYNNVNISSTEIDATGYAQGGTIKIGNDATNGTLPFALSTSLDAATSINASQLDTNQTNKAGGFIETSGNTIRLLASINAGRGGMWLIDPNDIVVDATTAASIVAGLANNDVTIKASAATTCTNATCSNTPTGTGSIAIISSITTNTNHNLIFSADGAILVNGGVNIWLNTSNSSTYTPSTGTGSLLMGGSTVSTITASNWISTCLTSCYAKATTSSPYAGIGLGVVTQATITGVTFANGIVSIMAGGNITVAGSNSAASNAYAGIAVFSGSTIYAGSSTNPGNIYFYGDSSKGVGLQISWGSSTAVDMRASQTIYINGRSTYVDTAANTGSDSGHGVFLNGAQLSAPTVQLTGLGSASCTVASNCAGLGLGWITQPAQTTNIYTNNLVLSADSVVLGQSPVAVGVCNGQCGGTSTLGTPVTTFGLNFAAYSQASGLPTAAMTFYYYGTLTTATSSTVMPMPGNNYGNYLVLPTAATTWSSYAFSSNANMSTSTGTFTVAGPVSLTGAQITLGGNISSTGLVTISNSGASSITGSLSGAGASFTKAGAGTLTISGAQSYTGTTMISAGTLQMGAGGSFASTSDLVMSGTANFDLNGISTTVASLTGALGNNIYNSATSTAVVLTVSSGTTTYAGLIKDKVSTGGTLGLTLNGGVLTLSNSNTYTGVTTISGGVLSVSVLAGGGTASGIGQSTSAAANLVINGGTLKFTGTNGGPVFDRFFTIGALGATIDASGTGAGALSFGSGGVGMAFTGDAVAPTLTLIGASIGTFNTTISNPASGVTAVTKSGTGTWNILASSTYTGVTTISGGVLSVTTLQNGGVASPIGQSTSDASNLVINGGTLKFTGTSSSTTNRLFTVGALGATIDSSGASGAITFGNASNLVIADNSSPTLTLAGSYTGANLFAPILSNAFTSGISALAKIGAGTWTLSGSNSYTGGTSVSGGTLKVGNVTALGANTSAVLVSSGGVLDLNGITMSGTNALTLNGTGITSGGALINSNAAAVTYVGNITLGSATSIGGTGGAITLNGVISGSADLTKVSSGTLILAGANVYTGGTTISAGTLKLGASSLLYCASGVVCAPGVETYNGVDATSPLGRGAITISGGVLDLNGIGNSTSGYLYNPITMAGTFNASSCLAGVCTTNAASLTSSTGTNVAIYSPIALNKGGDATLSTTSAGFDVFYAPAGAYLTLFGAISDVGVGAMPAYLQIGKNTNAASLGGTVILSGTSSYTGQLSINQAFLKLGSAQALSNSASIKIGIYRATSTYDNYSGGTYGSTSFTALDLAGQSISSSTALFSGALLNSTLTADVSGGIAVSSGQSGLIAASDGATLNIKSLGISTLSNVFGSSTYTGTVILSAANTAGTTALLAGGLLKLANASALPSAAPLTISGGTLDINGYSPSIGALSISGASTIQDSGSPIGSLTATAYSVTNASSTVTISAILAGAASLTKSGAGILLLSGANTYTGGVTVSGQGMVQMGTNYITNSNAVISSALGTGNVTINPGGILDLNGFSLGSVSQVSGIPSLTMAGTNATYLTQARLINSSTTSAVVYSSITLSKSPNVAGAQADLFAQNAGGIMTVNGLISDGAGANYAVVGVASSSYATYTGTVSFSNANTYSGGTAVAYGTLQAANATAFGTGAISVASGAALDLNGQTMSSTGILTLGGTGVTSSGALMNGSATGATYAGLIALGASTLIKGDTGTITLSNIGTISGSAFGLTLGGAQGGSIASIIGTGTGVLTTQDVGTWTLLGVNTFTGGITISAGTLKIDGSGSLGSGAYSGAITNNGSFYYSSSVNQTLSGVLGGTGALIKDTSTSSTLTLSAANTYSGNTTINAGTLQISGTSGSLNSGNYAGAILNNGVFKYSSSAVQRLNSVISGSGLLIKDTGTSKLTIAGANSYTGDTTISAGTIAVLDPSALGSGVITVQSGATLDLNGQSMASTTGALTLNGTLANGANAAATYSGLVTLGGNASILGLGAAINLTNLGTITGATYGLTLGGDTGGSIASIIGTGTGGLIKQNLGTWTLSGENTYSGGTTINGGTLKAGSATAFGTGTISVTGTTVAALDLNGQTMTSTGGLTLNGTGIGSGGALMNSSASAATYAGLATLGSAASIVGGAGTIALTNAGNITGAYALTLGGAQGGSVDSVIQNTSVTKAGTGTWLLTGVNTYSGGTTVAAGILKAGSATAFGTGSISVTGTTVAALDLNGKTMTSTGGLTLNGAGISNSGALMNSSATAATYAGLVTLGSAASIVGGTGTIALTNTGTITGPTYVLTLGGATGGSIASIIGTGTGRLIKQDAGSWILSGVNTYTGTTSINGGVLKLGVANAFSATTAVTVNAGGTLDVAGLSVSKAITLAGGTALSSMGTAGELKSGITLTADSTLAASSGSIFTVSTTQITGAFGLAIGAGSNLGTVILSGDAVTKAATSYNGITTVTSGAILDLRINSPTISTADPAFRSTYAGTGTIIIEPLTDNQTISLGGTGSTLNLPVYLFNGVGGTRKFADGLANIIIGSTSAGNVTVAGAATFTDSVALLSGGNITINSSASVSTSQAGGNLVVAATGNFFNLAGSSALSTTDGGSTDRWIVYSTQPSGDNFGASGVLVSGNKAYWGSTYATLAPSSVGAGNRYVFNTAGTVTLTTTNATMTYGVPIDLSSNYTTSNASLDAAPTGTPYISNVASDLFATAPTISSAGNTAIASVGQYDITASGAVGSTGFSTISYTDTGKLTVNPAVITLAVVGSKTYDGTADFDASPTNTNLTVSGLVNGNTLATVTANSPNVSANGSNYFVSFTMGSGTASNYELVSGYNASTNKATINPATLTVTANATNMTYGASALPTFTYSNGTLVAGNSFTGNLTSVAPVYNSGTFTANAGATYPITIGTLSAGSNYTISYTGANLTMVQAPLTITAATKTMTYGDNSLPNLTYTNSSLANGDASSVLTGSLSTTATAYNGTAGSASNAGTYLISQNTVSAGNNYDITYTGANLTVDKATLTVTGNSPGMTYGATVLPTLSYSYSGYVNGDSSAAGLSGTPTVSTTATVYNSGVSATGNAGATYAVTPSVSGVTSTNYNFATVNGSLLMVAAPLTVTATAENMTYGATAPPTLNYTTSALANGNSNSVLSGSLAASIPVYVAGVSATGDAGSTYTINQGTVTAGNNYTITYQPADVTVTKAVLTVAGNSPNMTYGATSLPTLSYGYSGYVNGDSSAAGLSGNPTVSTTAPIYSAGSSITGNAGATYAVTPSVSGVTSTNYTFAPSNGTLTMVAAPLNVTGTKVYNADGAFVYTQMSVSGAQNGESVTLTAGSATTSSPNVATYAGTSLSSLAIGVTGGNALASNYSLPSTGSLSITQATLTYEATPTTSIYGSVPSVNAGTVTGFAGTDTQANATSGTLVFATLADRTSNVGSYAINGSGLTANNGNYTFVQAAGNTTALTVNPATLTYTATPTISVYGATPSVNAGTITGFVNSQDQSTATTGTLTFTTLADHSSNVGSYAINGSGLTANNGNYNFVQASGNTTALTINPATLTYTATPTTSNYGSTPSVNAGTITGFVNGQDQSTATTGTLLFSTTATSASNVGSYAINGSGLTANNGNYNFIQASGNAAALTVNPAPLTVTGNKEYDGNGNFTYTQMAVSGAQNSETLALTAGSATTSGVNIGSYPSTTLSGATISVTGGNASAGNYALPSSGTLSITGRSITITADTQSTTYGSELNLGTTAFSLSGPLATGDAVTAVTLQYNGNAIVPATTNAATYTNGIVASGASGTGGFNATNYNITYAPANLVVNKATLTVTGNSPNMVYGATVLPTLSYSYSGYQNGETSAAGLTGTPTVSTNAPVYLANTTVTSNAGATYAVIPSVSGVTSTNYNFATANGTLTMTKATVNITANAASMTYGAVTLPNLTYANSSLANGDASSVLTGALSTTATAYSGTAGSASNAGTYPISQNTLSAGNNYYITYTGANVTIDKATLTVTGNSPNMTYGATSLPTLSYGYSGYVNGDSSAAGLAGAPTVSTNAPVYLANTSVTGNAGATYAVTPSVTGVSSTNYNFATANGTLTMTKAAITVTANAKSMTYGASTLPDLTYANSSLANGDASTVFTGALTSAAPVYNVASSTVTGNAGATYPITVGDLSAGNNYDITYTGANVTVNKATLTVTGNSPNMVYGATVLPSLSYGYSGYANGDSSAAGLSGTPTVSTTAPVYSAGSSITGNAGATYVVTPSVSGVSSTNYNFATANGTLTMTKAAITVTANAKSMTYGASTLPDLTYTYSGLANGNTNSIFSGALSTTATAYNGTAGSASNVGTYPISQNTISAGNNYDITYTGANLSVGKATVTYSGSAQFLSYNATTRIASNTYILSGVLSTDTAAVALSVTPATGLNADRYYDSNAQLTGLASGNYQLTSTGSTYGILVINPAYVTYRGSTTNPTYNASTQTASNTYMVYGVFGADIGKVAVTATAATGTNAGTYYDTNALLSLTGSATGNYQLSPTNNQYGSLVIAKAPLTITEIASLTGNIYNGSAQTGTYSTTFLGSDASHAVVSGMATGINVGTYTSALSVANATGYTVLSNYNNPAFVNANLVISPKPLTINGQLANNKVYDSTTNGGLNSVNATLVGIVGSDSVALNSSAAYGTFADPNVANGIAVTVVGNALSGSAAGNYSLSQPTGLTANITPAPLMVTANNDSKFIGQSDPVGFNGVSYSGFVGSQDNSVLGGTLAITRTNSSQNNAGTYTGVLRPAGLTSANYSIAYTNGNFTIVAAETLLIKSNNTSATYGSSFTFTPLSVQYLNNSLVLVNLNQTTSSGNTYTYSDGVGGSATFTLAAVGQTSTSGNLVVGNYSITGLNFSKVGNNFNGAPVYDGVLAVTKQAVTASTSSVSKVYDGTTAMNGLAISLSPVVSGDQVTAGGAGAFAQSNTGSNINYSVANLALSGADSGNYDLTGGTSFSGSNGVITPATLTYTATPSSSVYGNTPIVNAGVVSGFVSGENQGNATAGTLLFSTAATAASNVGGYAVNGSGLTANGGNYNFVQAPGNNAALIINPATLTYTAMPATSVSGTTPIVDAGTITGYVNSQNQSSATTGTLLFSTNATSASGAGSYAINGSGLTANNGNYIFVQAPANATALTITPAPTPTPTPEAGSGLSVFNCTVGMDDVDGQIRLEIGLCVAVR